MNGLPEVSATPAVLSATGFLDQRLWKGQPDVTAADDVLDDVVEDLIRRRW